MEEVFQPREVFTDYTIPRIWCYATTKEGLLKMSNDLEKRLDEVEARINAISLQEEASEHKADDDDEALDQQAQKYNQDLYNAYERIQIKKTLGADRAIFLRKWLQFSMKKTYHGFNGMEEGALHQFYFGQMVIENMDFVHFNGFSQFPLGHKRRIQLKTKRMGWVIRETAKSVLILSLQDFNPWLKHFNVHAKPFMKKKDAVEETDFTHLK